MMPLLICHLIWSITIHSSHLFCKFFKAFTITLLFSFTWLQFDMLSRSWALRLIQEMIYEMRMLPTFFKTSWKSACKLWKEANFQILHSHQILLHCEDYSKYLLTLFDVIFLCVSSHSQVLFVKILFYPRSLPSFFLIRNFEFNCTLLLFSISIDSSFF